MASCPDLRKAFNNFGDLSDSNACFNDPLKHNNAFLDNEIEPIDDSSAIVINARDKYRLFKDSTSNKVSLNTKFDQIIKDHLDWHAYAPDAKMVYIPKPWISRIANQLTEQQISEIARDVSKEFKDTCLMLRGEFTILSFLDVVVTWLRINETPNRQIQNPDDFQLLLKHDMGYNFSLLLKEVFKCIIGDYFHMEMESTTTENMLALRVLNSQNPHVY
jgi:hypothetical protein